MPERRNTLNLTYEELRVGDVVERVPTSDRFPSHYYRVTGKFSYPGIDRDIDGISFDVYLDSLDTPVFNTVRRIPYQALVGKDCYLLPRTPEENPHAS
jgi:hypothetical protein